MSTAASLNSVDGAKHQNYLLKLWLEEHQRKLIELVQTLGEIMPGDWLNGMHRPPNYCFHVRDEDVELCNA